MRISAVSPTLILVSWVSRKFACTHLVFSTNEIIWVPGRDQLSRADLPLADRVVGRRDNPRVAQVHLRDRKPGFFGVEVGRSCNSCDSSTALPRRSASRASSLLRNRV